MSEKAPGAQFDSVVDQGTEQRPPVNPKLYTQPYTWSQGGDRTGTEGANAVNLTAVSGAEQPHTVRTMIDQGSSVGVPEASQPMTTGPAAGEALPPVVVEAPASLPPVGPTPAP